ncbi:TPA: GNAT family N-acetyltransferase [Klebsiella oxytoca]|uniref:GNAT family N-acetyltransferase n=1 Tax=Klebsiella oxytoca TaxID=571 RepID=UPI00024FE6DE|nr:GNAT family N-acetyltransferase [Klebsiella oxytoca]EHT00607.1 hypothetical protein HMPREF9689_01382 [Klebsiella oxytoca 10-5245]HBL6845262.1 GNAT family N-acetyltransferase [Klebsiella oxytoca]HBM3153844.1 GNAT family N-acetyltransferase [Klebsiella oxytoca]HCJ0414450.1 GNAT family N-acetyltransferase [Klebsiella oxytoca]
MLNWRQVQSHEVPLLSMIGKECYLFHFENSWENKEELAHFIEENYSYTTLSEDVKNQKLEWYFFEDDSEIVGFCKLEASSKPEEIYLHKLYFKSNKTGKGYGKEAFKLIESLAKNKSFKSIALDVLESNVGGKSFYLNMGMKQIGVEQLIIGDTNHTLHLMKKELM